MEYILSTTNEVIIYLPRFIFIMLILVCFFFVYKNCTTKCWTNLDNYHCSYCNSCNVANHHIHNYQSNFWQYCSFTWNGRCFIYSAFRNPVRSPLELTVYFCAITMGIAVGVSLKWLAFLGIAIVMALIILIVINNLSKNLLNKLFFTTSFSEGIL